MSKKKYPPLILQLCERRPSAFIMKGTEGSDNPDRLDTSSEYLLLNTSIMIDAKGQRVPIRYIKGCEKISIEEQEKDKRKPNPREDYIAFSFGTLTVERDGLHIGLYDYLANHANNRSLDPSRRPTGAENVFYQINTEKEAEDDLEDVDDIAEALATIVSLREKIPASGGKPASFDYDTERIDYLCKLFGVIGIETEAEKLQVLRAVANANPKFFNDLIKEATTDLRIAITTARELGVIATDGPDASWVDDGKSFYKFKEKKNFNKRIDELIEHFNNKENQMDLDVLRTKVAAKKESLLQ